MNELKKLVLNGTEYTITDGGAVAFDTVQTLSSAQQAQARKNVGAGTVTEEQLATAIAAEETARETEIAVERARIDLLSTIEEGSTTGDAELQDIRVGADGAIYSTAGNAVRGQINGLTEVLEQNGQILDSSGAYLSRRTAGGANVIDGAPATLKILRGNTVDSDGVLTDATVSSITSMGRNRLYPPTINRTVNGVTFKTNSDQSITVTGTATAKTYQNIINLSEKNLPKGRYAICGNPEPVDITIGAYTNNGATWVKDLMTGRGNFVVDWNGYDTLKFSLYLYTGYTANCTFTPMIRFASAVGQIEPYVEHKYTLPVEITLSKFDHIDFARKKIVRQSGIVSRAGTESWGMTGTVEGNTWRFGMADGQNEYQKFKDMADHTSVVFNHYKLVGSVAEGIAAGSGAIMHANGYMEIIDTAYTTVADFKAHLAELAAAGTPLTVKYQTSTITEEDLDITDDTYIAYKDGFEIINGNGVPCTLEQRYITQPAVQSSVRTPIVTFIDDDGTIEGYTNWELIGDATGIRNTFAVVTGRTDPNWETVERLRNKGFEFISHTHNHINIPNTDEATVRTDFAASIATLREHWCDPKYLVYPYNAHSTASIALVKQYYQAGIWQGNKVNVPPINPYKLFRYSVLTDETEVKEVNGTTMTVAKFKTLGDFKAIIDEAVEVGGWVIFMTHLFTNVEGRYHCDADVRNLLVEVCKYAVQAGAKVEPFGKAFAQFNNRLAAGMVTDATHCVVDCDGNVYNG